MDTKDNSALWTEVELLNSKLHANPKSLVFAKLADNYRKLGMLDEAFEVTTRGLRLRPDYLSALVVLGKIHMDKERTVEATDVFERVIKLDPNNLVSLTALAAIHFDFQQYTKCQKIYTRILKLDPYNEHAQVGLESIAQFLPKEEQAISSGGDFQERDLGAKAPAEAEPAISITSTKAEVVERSVIKKPSALEETVTMGDLYLQQGLLSDALETYRKVLRKDPDNQAMQAKVAATEAQLRVESGAGEDQESAGYDAAFADFSLDSPADGASVVVVASEPEQSNEYEAFFEDDRDSSSQVEELISQMQDSAIEIDGISDQAESAVTSVPEEVDISDDITSGIVLANFADMMDSDEVPDVTAAADMADFFAVDENQVSPAEVKVPGLDSADMPASLAPAIDQEIPVKGVDTEFADAASSVAGIDLEELQIGVDAQVLEPIDTSILASLEDIDKIIEDENDSQLDFINEIDSTEIEEFETDSGSQSEPTILDEELEFSESMLAVEEFAADIELPQSDGDTRCVAAADPKLVADVSDGPTEEPAAAAAGISTMEPLLDDDIADQDGGEEWSDGLFYSSADQQEAEAGLADVERDLQSEPVAAASVAPDAPRRQSVDLSSVEFPQPSLATQPTTKPKTAPEAQEQSGDPLQQWLNSIKYEE